LVRRIFFVNAKDNNGMTPLHVAAYRDHKGVADLLRQHGGHE
jgi:ankyrin repeat protein